MDWIQRAWKTYGKAIVAVAMAAATAAQAGLADGHISTVEWVQVAIAATTAIGVWLVPIHPDWPWIKTAVAALLAALQAAATLIVGGISAADWTGIILAGLTVLVVGRAPAASTPPRPAGATGRYGGPLG